MLEMHRSTEDERKAEIIDNFKRKKEYHKRKAERQRNYRRRRKQGTPRYNRTARA